MEIFLEKENKIITKALDSPIKIIELLNELKINKESIIIVKNNNIALEDEIINNEDNIKILSVVSGG